MREITNEIIPTELAEWLDRVVQIDETTLARDLGTNPAVEHEISKHMLNVAVKVAEIEKKLDSLRRKMTIDTIYANTEDKQVNNLKLSRSEVERFVEQSDEVTTLRERLARAQAALDFFERSIRVVRQKNNNMGNIIKYRAFMAGQ